MDELLIDMSPMIDMVFLLLIFFMVNAVIIDYRKDKRVEIPKATVAKAPDNISGRIIINVFDDTTANEEGYRFADENSNALTEAEITEAVKKRKLLNDEAGIKPTTLHLRADSKADVIWTKRAVKAAGDAGVINVIFSSFNVN
ncbi:MAG: biopolymer transporter ExbD [Verrucomicrobiales bacterium]|nr:biopolymer transporter ExbD [Verrucomicrobiales bacterium]